MDTNAWTERVADFGLDKLTNMQSFALQVYVGALASTHLASTFTQRQYTYLGVQVSVSNVGSATAGGSAAKDASYMLSMMGRWEYNLQRYSNFLTEPNDQM